MFRKNSRLALLSVLIAGCWTGPTASERPATPLAPPRASRPALPEVRAVEVGVWDAAEVFRATFDIALTPGQTFGWRLLLPCAKGWVPYREQMRLPAPGDWPADPEMQVSLDGRSVTIQSSTICLDGWIEKRWSVAPDDPAGVWTLEVTPEGYATKTFRVTFAPAP